MCLKQLINYAFSVHRTGCPSIGHHLVKTNTNPPQGVKTLFDWEKMKDSRSFTEQKTISVTDASCEIVFFIKWGEFADCRRMRRR